MIHLVHLETDITTACQLSCVGCNHEVPLYRAAGPPRSAEPAQVESDLAHLGRVAHADTWGALGGEPTLSSKLVDILHVVRASGVADRIEVWTNGLTARKLKPEFWRALDVLVLSIYPGKLTDNDVAWIRAKCVDEGVQLDEKDERYHPNFKTLLEPTPTNAEATRAKFAGCFFRHFSRVVNFGYFFTCCCAPHMPMLIQGRPFGSDGVPVADITEAQLKAYLERVEPLGACTICAGRDTAVDIVWSEERNPLMWVEKSGQRL